MKKILDFSVFCDWLESWNSIFGKNGKLTKETFTALHHTIYAFLELTKYCIEELKILYILPGKFQTDHLEERFGQYRRLRGDHYNISIRQVFEREKKLRMLSVLKLNLPFNKQYIKIDLKNLQEPNWDEVIEEQEFDSYKFRIDVKEDDINKCREVLPVILAGYCYYAVFKKIKCNSCKDLISGRDNVEEIPEINCYFQGINRGSLLYPNDITTNFVLYNYVVIDKLIKNNSFFHSMNQRKLAMHISLNILADNELLFNVDTCDEGHNIEKIQRMFVWSSTSALFNNFCSRENNNISINKLSKKRKFQTFS